MGGLIRENGLNMERFLYQLADLAVVMDHRGILLWVNQAFVGYIGLPEEEVLAMSFLDFIHQDERAAVGQLLISLMEEKKKGTTVVRFCADRQIWRCLEWSLYWDAENDCYYAIARDITGQKALEEERLQLHAIVEASLDAIYAIGIDGTIFSWNKAAADIFGYSKEEVLGENIHILSLSGQEDEIEEIIALIQQGSTYSYETVRQKKNKELVTVFVTLAPMRDSLGGIVGASAVARDITKYQKAEREMAKLDKLNTIAELASVISHEVRNPMTTVSGFLQMLRKKARDKKQKEYFDIMQEEIDRINAILSEFITIGKNKEVKREKQDLNEIIRNMAPLLEADAAYQGKIIRFNLGETPDVLVNSNEMRQVLLNFTRNGLEAMEPNGILQIRTFLKGSRVVLSIKDNGHGIKEEDLEKLGSAFFSTKETGTGLGLYVCYEILRRHNATLSIVTSEKGTTFLVEFEASSQDS